MLAAKLVNAVLEEAKVEMSNKGELSELQALTSGPVPLEPLPTEDSKYGVYWDGVHAGFLDRKLVQEARAEEIRWIHKNHVYIKRPRSEAIAKGITPIHLLWRDTNKGDELRPNYRSRIVVMEKRGKGKEGRVMDESQLFMGMPPLEGIEILGSVMAAKRVSANGKALKIGFFDVRRAFFVEPVEREI